MLELGPEAVEVVDRNWVVVFAKLVEPFAAAAGDPNSGGVVVAFEVEFAGSASGPLFAGVACDEFALDVAAVLVLAGDDTAPAADWTCWED